MIEFLNFTEVVISGLMAGVLYSLVALGFVLIFKASGIFNFAQGVFALFAALAFVGFMKGDVPFGPVLHELGVEHWPDWARMLFSGAISLILGSIVAGLAGFTTTLKTRSARNGSILGVAAGVFVFFEFAAGHVFGHALPVWTALVLSILVMTGLAFLVVRIVLKPLVNTEPIILFMATIGLAFVLEGLGDMMWGSNVKSFDFFALFEFIPQAKAFLTGAEAPTAAETRAQLDTLGLQQGGSFWVEDFTRGLVPNAEERGYFGMFILRLDIVAAIIAAALVVALALFFQYTKTGRALRAVADDHQAALSVGISLTTIWVIVWAVAGYVALAAGIVWGAPSGVQFSLSLIALKALPVLMLGGFTSEPGAIIGGLIVGVGEKLAEFYTGWIMNGVFGANPDYFTAIQSWFAYMLALIFLLFRPQGLFGEKIIERV